MRHPKGLMSGASGTVHELTSRSCIQLSSSYWLLRASLFSLLLAASRFFSRADAFSVLSGREGCETCALLFLFISPGKKMRTNGIALSTELCHIKGGGDCSSYLLCLVYPQIFLLHYGVETSPLDS